MFEEMAGSMGLLRGLLGVIGIGCAYMLGRSVLALLKGWQKKSSVYRWLVRTAACLLAMAVRFRIDVLDIAAWALSAAAFAFAFWFTSRERKQEDLTDTMFPDDK
jgi:hypothetical protein